MIDKSMTEDERLDIIEQLDKMYSNLQNNFDKATTNLMFSKFGNEQSFNYMHPNSFRILPALVQTNIHSDALIHKTFNLEQNFTIQSDDVDDFEEEEYQVKEIQDEQQMYYILENNFGQIKQNQAIHQAQDDFKKVIDDVIQIVNLRNQIIQKLG